MSNPMKKQRKDHMMKRWFVITAALLACLGTFGWASADQATPKEVVQKVTEAVKLIQEQGEAAFPKISDPNGLFMWKDTYCFVFDLNGTIVAHPANPKLIGKNMMATKDVKGNLFAAEFVAIAKSPEGKGWSEYWWPKPGATEPSLKTSFIMKVPGKDYFAGAGLYDITKEEAAKQAGQ
uniref:Sodium:calcium antiporter n=1 Tax=Desulfacinum infernum TaxID=35837 RepID=A0A831ZK23_9BACT